MVFGAVLAGGKGSRMGNYTVPKQFLLAGGKPIIVHVVEKFLAHPEIDHVIVGVNPEWLQHMLDITEKYLPDAERLTVIAGGVDRNSTIANVIGEINRISGNDDDIVVTHDAVRPFVTLKMISDNIRIASEHGVCDTVVPATDTIVYSDNHEYITDVPIRSNTYQGQTPQSFNVRLFEKVYSEMTDEELEIVTDACKMFMMKGYPVYLAEGHVSNFKVTYPEDYKMAQVLLGDNIGVNENDQ
ncbi:MAG: 2-C-methyl-D-erythritol 4-phosphate cytidylyltransferase [Alistipes sp.]|nr:2-C-methyl-D-erythritol 4-phosphate cytidylyltransferase [Alistipes sp.]